MSRTAQTVLGKKRRESGRARTLRFQGALDSNTPAVRAAQPRPQAGAPLAEDGGDVGANPQGGSVPAAAESTR